MMENFIAAILSDEDEYKILELFFLHPVSKDDVCCFTNDQLELAANRLFAFLINASMNSIIDIVEDHKDMIPELTTKDIPMFSDLKAVDMVPGVAQSNPGATFPELGKILLPNNKPLNQRKWAETHYRLAAMMKLVENGTTAEVTFLGREYAKLARPGSGSESLRMRDTLRPRLCLCSPCIQLLIVKSRRQSFNAMQMYREMLTENTAVRRRSCTKQMLNAIYESCEVPEKIAENMIWK